MQPNRSMVSLSSLAVSLPQQEQLQQQRNRRNTTWLICSKVERFFKLLMYWLLNVSLFAALISSLFVQKWRKILVDRKSLKQLQSEGKIDASQLESSIAFSRNQGIYMECFLTICKFVPLRILSKIHRKPQISFFVNDFRDSQC